MLFGTIAPVKGTLVSLANKTRADSTSAWERITISGIVEDKQAFFLWVCPT